MWEVEVGTSADQTNQADNPAHSYFDDRFFGVTLVVMGMRVHPPQ